MVVSQKELRVIVGRRLLVEDALWAGDVLTSSLRHDGPAHVMVPMLLAGHTSRIVYEGRELLTSATPGVALPTYADLLPPDEHPSIALARHATKMLDNQTRKDKPLSEFENEIHRAWMSQRALLFKTVRRGFTWMQPDLGFYTLGGDTVGATIPMHLRFGLDAVPRDEYPDFFRRYGEDLISSLAIYSSLPDAPEANTSTLGLSAIDAVKDNDRFVKRYLGRHYDRALSTDQKLLLLLIESELATATVLIPLVTGAHTAAAFRARFVSLWHALSSLSKILEARPDARSPAAERVRDIVSSADVERLSGKGMQAVRNRCVHYEIRGRIEFAFTDGPMFGIIESLTDETFDSLDALVGKLSAALRTALRQWRES